MENERVSYVRNDCLVFFCVVVREWGEDDLKYKLEIKNFILYIFL